MSALEFDTVTFQGRTLALVQGSKFRKFFDKLRKGSWEPDTFDFFRRSLDGETILLDVGGWIGVTSVWASELARQVIVVEPEPYCSAVIAETIRRNKAGNVTLVAAALTDSASVDFHVVGDGGSSESSLIPRPGSKVVSVPGITVAQLSAMAGEQRRVVKIDVEGYEYALGSKICAFSHPKLAAVQIALHPAAIARGSGGFWPFNRLKAARETQRLIRELESCFGPARVRGYASVRAYLVSGIVFSRKARGTELEFAPLQRQ